MKPQPQTNPELGVPLEDRSRPPTWLFPLLSGLLICLLASLASPSWPTSQGTSPEPNAPAPIQASAELPENEVTPEDFLELLIGPVNQRLSQVDRIRKHWQPGFAPMLVEVLRFERNPATTRAILRLLKERSGRDNLGESLDELNEWLWKLPENPIPRYQEFKGLLYQNLDPKFSGYFDNSYKTTIRLDEIQWGGVVQDGIPPLRNPPMIDASEAAYLDDKDVIFGLEINGDVRAYPKRILAWHEMFTDTVGGVPVAGVYCTLCGSAVLYETNLDGVQYDLGTSGFLYRSNKLMFDQETQSLWNTLWGRPALGPLVGKDIQLASRSIVTSRWGEWRKRHPKTKVLSLETGYERDYSEGTAYKDYFATDKLMFAIPTQDKRLKNKAEILALTNEDRTKALAISEKFLSKKPVFQVTLEGLDLVIFTDGSGANRAYRADGVTFKKWDQKRTATDEQGGEWKITEDQLVGPEGTSFARYPAHRAFWFGWHAAYPETKLIK